MKTNEHPNTVMFQLTKVLGITVAIGNVKFTEDQLIANTERSINFPGLPPQEGMAERQIPLHQGDDEHSRSVL